MSPAVASVPLPTKSEIEEWSTSHLSEAASTWRTAAAGSETAFDEHRQNVSAPGGTTWEGNAKDAALDRVTADIGVVGCQSGVLREAAGLAENGAYDIKAAKDKAVQAITAAIDDGFNVAEDLSVTDSRDYDINTVADRNRAAAEHAEDIRWAAQQLMQADQLVGSRLEAKAADLEGIRFEGEGERDAPSSHVQFVDNKVQDKQGDGKDGKSGTAEQATGQIGPFAVPKSVEDAAKKSGLKPDGKPPDPSGLGDLLGANDNPADKPGESKPGVEKQPGLPPALSQLPPAPDKATIDQQRAKVDAARQNLSAAESKQKAAAGLGYVQGAGSGPSPDEFKSLTQAVFDARHELTKQTDALRELSAAAAANDGPTVPVPPLPIDADKQAFPPQPSVLERGAGAFGEGMKDASKTVWDATMPDVGNMYDVATDWDGATAEQKAQAGIDAASMLPFPGSKILGEGIEHGLDALGAAGRHLDDAPTPHADAPSGGHAPLEAPHHSPPDAPAEHHAPAPTHVDDVPSGGHGDAPVHADTAEAPHHTADTVDHTVDTGHAAPYGIEDTGALLTASENAGGHLIERHVGQTFDDLSARLDAGPRPGAVSTFSTAEEASTAVSTALQHNQATVDAWVANGATDRLRISVPFDGGEVLVRGSTATVPGTSVLVVLEGIGNGEWIVLTGYPKP
ncbi:hypothetical protein HGA11_19535 [Mycolicibacterium septicum DSM 44393]|uniref:Bacterial CdiA-CT RNAse A domain-containing protein n=1 Tax=Mycolicibacterium septicum DSM 44393 TaxID=1341646 RepID=A0A7X6MQR0_9MYCO|nr:RNase A-like domain-containing protein [Mycolicibacterium septicum]NKZ13172.1 hypothetical protein [Mycolicibacterium septicum DSM 44393]